MSLQRRLKRVKEREIEKLSKIERRVLDILERVQAKLPHPVLGIVIGFLIAFAGRSELVLRSWGLLLIVAWLTVDLWAWLLPKSVRYNLKYALGCTATNAMLITMMGIMWWWMNGKLADQREDVFNQLKVEIHTPPGDGDAVVRSTATVINGGHFDIGARQIWCKANRVEWEDGTVIEGGLKLGMFMSELPLKAGGDGQTDVCMSAIQVSNTLPSGEPRRFRCGDVTVMVNYSLTTQPLIQQHKFLRFNSNRDTNFEWRPQPEEYSGSYCPEPKKWIFTTQPDQK